MLLRSKLFQLAMLSSLLLLPSCQHITPQMTPTLETKTAVCAAVKIVQVSHSDTLDTINAVRSNNAALRTLCPVETKDQ